jgi:hypothetical protein
MVSCTFAHFVQLQLIEESKKPSHDFLQHDIRKLKALTPAETRLRKTAAEPKAACRLSPFVGCIEATFSPGLRAGEASHQPR